MELKDTLVFTESYEEAEMVYKLFTSYSIQCRWRLSEYPKTRWFWLDLPDNSLNGAESMSAYTDSLYRKKVTYKEFCTLFGTTRALRKAALGLRGT